MLKYFCVSGDRVSGSGSPQVGFDGPWLEVWRVGTILRVLELLNVHVLTSSCCRTLKERAERLFSTKGKRLEDLDTSLLAKAKPGKTAKTA